MKTFMIQADMEFFLQLWGIAHKDDKSLLKAIAFHFFDHLDKARTKDEGFWDSFLVLADLFARRGLFPLTVAMSIQKSDAPKIVRQRVKQLIGASQNTFSQRREKERAALNAVPYSELVESVPVSLPEGGETPIPSDNVVDFVGQEQSPIVPEVAEAKPEATVTFSTPTQEPETPTESKKKKGLFSFG